MKVEELMTASVKACRLDDSLNTAAQIMWDNDCGCVPVVDPADYVVGMLTDRDVCMAAYIQGRPLREIRVSSAMSRGVFTCKLDDTVAAAEEVMRMHQIRRLPVVDERGCLVGILSLNDIACEAERERSLKGKRQITADEVAVTLGTICGHRGQRDLTAAA
jgi:CBS domain-containing protein